MKTIEDIEKMTAEELDRLFDDRFFRRGFFNGRFFLFVFDRVFALFDATLRHDVIDEHLGALQR